MKRTLLIASSAILLAACAGYQTASYDPDADFITFNHPFTESAIADVQARAEKLCGQRKQVALQTSRSCSLKECATHYKCTEADSAAK